MGSRLISALPVIVLVIAATGLAVLGARSITAERAAAEQQARTRLIERATDGAARLTAAARLAMERASGISEPVSDACLLVSSGRFVQPVEPTALAPLELPPGRDLEGELYLAEARRSESDENGLDRAIGLYRAAGGKRRAPACRALARLRLAALLRRGGDHERADELLQSLLDELPEGLERTREALMARALLAREDDMDLASDLLACVGGGDEALALGLLEQAGRHDARALSARRRELEDMAFVRSALDLERLPEQGARLVTETRNGGLTIDLGGMPPDNSVERSVILAFASSGLESGSSSAIVLALAPALPEGVVVLERWRADEGVLHESVPAGSELLGVLVVASMPLADLDAEVRSRTMWLGGVLVALLGGGALAGLATMRATRREASAVRARAELLARVGHDLRTPLALIRMYGETLAAGKVDDPEQAREFAGIVARESERLSAEVAAALDLTRIDARALAPGRTDVGALTSQVAEAHRPLLEAEAIHLDLQSAATDGDLLALADEAALRGAIGNLLDNARRHAASGGEVRVEAIAEHDRVVVRVSDRGEGIPTGSEGLVFERFVRAPGATGRGTGLGLALVREVAEAHGGGASARGREGGGAVVELWLPRVEAS